MTNKEAIRIISNYDTPPCGYCHQGGEEIEVAFRKAIEALETLQPKLLTLGEIINAKNKDVYLEETCETQTHPLRLVETEIESRYQASFFWPSIVRPLKAYGKTWRCWTAKPTPDEMKTPWDDT